MAKQNESDNGKLKIPILCEGCWIAENLKYSECWFYWEGKKYCPSKSATKGE